MAKVKIIDMTDNFGDYKLHYRRVTGNQCPEIVVKKAWILVGDISFRPDEFVDALEKLKQRPDFKDHVKDVESNKDFINIQQAKLVLLHQLNNLLGLKTISPDEMKNVSDWVQKSIAELEMIEKRYALFE